jgi:hypothetical protein
MKRGEKMNTFHEQYLTDSAGKRMAVVLPITTWEKILDALEELDEIREYDKAKRDPDQDSFEAFPAS